MVGPVSANVVSPVTTSPAGGVSATPTPGGGGGKNFMDVLMNSLDEVNRLQADADQSVKALYTGKTDDVASVLTAVNKAGIAFDLLMEIRNKMTDAYREIQQIRL